MKFDARTTSVDATRQVAAVVAQIVDAGDVILLAGELGAGKTAFTQGFGASLGVDEQITSPTFTLARHYEGRIPLHHIDVYRLERFSEMADIGISELIDGDGVVMIEWGDAIAPALPSDYLEIRLTFGPDDDARNLEFRCVGRRWADREPALRKALSDWTGEG